MVFWSNIFIARSDYLWCKTIFEALFLYKNVSFSWFFASLKFSSKRSMNWWKMRKSKFFLVVCTTVINAKFLHNVWPSEKLKSSLIFIFFTENNSQWKKSRLSSGKYLAAVFPPQLKFEGAKLIFFRISRRKKI